MHKQSEYHTYCYIINQLVVPSGHVLKSTLDASSLAWPAEDVLTTSILNPASWHNLQFQNMLHDMNTKKNYTQLSSLIIPLVSPL